MKISNDNTQGAPDELIKQLNVSEQEVLEEHNEIEDKPTEEDIKIEEAERNCTSQEEEPAKPQPPQFTTKDVAYFSVRQGFGEPTAVYSYKDAFGYPVGYIVRWDVKLASGGTEKKFIAYRYNEEKKRWEAKFFGNNTSNSRPLYNLPEVIARRDATVLIVEGEKTANAAKLLFPEFVVTTSSGGAKAANKTDWSHLKGRDIIVSPDAEGAGTEYLKGVLKELRLIGSKVSRLLEPSRLSAYVIKDEVITQREGGEPKGYDLADAYKDGWTAQLIKQAQERPEFQPFFKTLDRPEVLRDELKENEQTYELKAGTFKLAPTGLYRQYFVNATAEDLKHFPDSGYNENDLAIGVPIEKWSRLCGYLKPTHEIKDTDNSWGMLITFKDINGVAIETFLKRLDLLSEKGAVGVLYDQGLDVPQLKKHIFDFINGYLNEFKPEFKAVGVDMVGWQNDNSTYMLPFADDGRNHYAYTKEGEKPITYILQQKGTGARLLKKKGTLAEWQRTVGAVTRGNHLHTFAILAALTAPALKLLNEEGGLFHYAGNTSIGKSTIMHVAKSVWGYENLGSFRTTDNAMESICKNGNDGALFFDEIGEVEPEALDKAIYMLGNGATKGRSDRNGNIKATTNFIVVAQTTGEMGLVARLAEKNKKAKGGQLIRMAELDADRHKGFKTFDVLNINPDTKELFTSGKEQADYLKTHAKENGGVVIDSYLTEVVKDIEGFKSDLKTVKTDWLKAKFTGEEGVEVARMAKRFSTVLASGVMAVTYRVLPHSIDEIKQSVNAMFNNWLDRFGGDASYELKSMIDDLRKLCIEQQYARFCNAEPDLEGIKTLPREKAGYWSKEKNEFWIHPSVFERDVLKGKDKKVFYPLLDKEGYIEKEEKDRYTTKRQPAKESRQTFIVINAAVLLGGAE